MERLTSATDPGGDLPDGDGLLLSPGNPHVAEIAGVEPLQTLIPPPGLVPDYELPQEEAPNVNARLADRGEGPLIGDGHVALLFCDTHFSH